MGYYIEVPANSGKAELLVVMHDAKILAGRPAWGSWPDDKALIVVVDNGLFEAAAYAFDEAEYNAFHTPGDNRPRTYVLMDKKAAQDAVLLPERLR